MEQVKLEEYLKDIKKEANQVIHELLEQADLTAGDIVVVGCSSSEAAGKVIGTSSSYEIAEAIFDGIYSVVKEKKLFLACQCCEHLNRAIIIEKEAARREKIPTVNVIPQVKAGSSFATAAYHKFHEPVAVEHIKAQAGIDIGDTLIGMHLQEVAVPVRTATRTIGNAHVVCARTREKYIGGERAIYHA